MKKLLLISTFSLFFSINIYAQWVQLTSPSTNNLYCVFFNIASTGYLSGATNGNVIKTTDGGVSWIFTNTGTSSTFYEFRFLDLLTGYVVGTNKQVIKTTNSGLNWDIKTSGTGTLYSIAFQSPTTCYAAGSTPTVIDKSVDGGNNWSAITPPTSNPLRGVFFINNTLGWFCGYSGTIWKTTDGAFSWIPQTQSSSYNFEKIYFKDVSTGFVVGSNGTILKSTNGGTNWFAVPSGTTNYLYDMYYYYPNTGWAVGASGRIQKTTDDGNTWYQQNSPSGTATYYGIHMVDANTGYIVGSGGILLKTTNGGGVVTTPLFQKLTTGQIVTDINKNNRCAWGDYDNDGYQDLVISSHNDSCLSCTYPLLLYHNNGDGTFTRVTNNAIANEPPSRTYGLTWGDYDNDGLLDLFVCVGWDLNNLLFHNNGNGNFTKVTTGSIVNDGGWSEAAAWADYDRDGWIDLFVANGHVENNFLYHNNGNGTFTKITSGSIVHDSTYSRGCAWGDYDNDGYPDLFVVNYLENDMQFHNNGNGTFTRILSGPPVTEQLWGSGCAWGDYDNDGLLDLFVTNNGDHDLLYHNNGGGNFSLTNLTPSIDGGVCYGVCWADYDNDGYLDLFVNNYYPNNFLYKNNGGTSFIRILNEPMSIETGIESCWGDYNNDGKIDLFSTKLPSNALYRNVGATGNYLICKLRGGCTSNKAGIGARIRIKAGNYSAIREVSAGSSMGTEDMLWQHFGLGNISSLDSVIVYWPSGNIQRLTNVTSNQTIVIDECLIGITNNQTPAKYELLQNYPNPFNPSTTLEYSILKTSHVRLSIFTLNGELIKTMVDSKQNAGSYSIQFDGSAIASGVYFYRIETDEFTDSRKMMLIK